MFLGILECFHTDLVLSIYIHLQFSTFSHAKLLLGLDYFAIVFLCLLVIGMAVLYSFMFYTVHRLTKAYFEHSVIEIKDMPNEKFAHWLADKKPEGNFFQRNLNVLLLLRDVFNCTVLMGCYSNVLLVMILVSSVHFAFALLAIVCKPYQSPYQNLLLIITESSYLVLDLLFLGNIIGRKMSPQMRYYAMGFSMIGVVMLIIISNIGIIAYHKSKDVINLFKGQNQAVEAAKVEEHINQSIKNEVSHGAIINADDSSGVRLEKLDSPEAGNSPPSGKKRNLIQAIKHIRKTTLTRPAHVKQQAKENILGALEAEGGSEQQAAGAAKEISAFPPAEAGDHLAHASLRDVHVRRRDGEKKPSKIVGRSKRIIKSKPPTDHTNTNNA